MSRSARFLVPFSALLIFSVSGACSGEEGVDPNKFATDVCTAAGDWVRTIQEGAASFGSGLSSSSSPEQIRDGLVGFLEDAISETDELIGEVEDAGVPAVDGGEDASETLTTAFEDVRVAFEDARDQAADLPTDDQQAFATQAQELGTTVQESLAAIGAELEDQENDELAGAFDENEACTELQNAS